MLCFCSHLVVFDRLSFVAVDLYRRRTCDSLFEKISCTYVAGSICARIVKGQSVPGAKQEISRKVLMVFGFVIIWSGIPLNIFGV